MSDPTTPTSPSSSSSADQIDALLSDIDALQVCAKALSERLITRRIAALCFAACYAIVAHAWVRRAWREFETLGGRLKFSPTPDALDIVMAMYTSVVVAWCQRQKTT